MASNDASTIQNSRLAPLRTPRAVTTPNRRAISAEPTSGRFSASVRRNNAATPHGRAAIRAMDQRRTALLTPGRVARRRSLREQRETPRDHLRMLSRVLAPTTTVISSSSSSPGSQARDDNPTLPFVLAQDEEADEDFPIERPRFSLPLAEDDDEDDDSDLKPPRSSGLEEENYTVQSIELPRRAVSETPLNRFDRASLGSTRFSDYIGPDFQSDDVGIDSGFFPPPTLDDTGEVFVGEDAIERLDDEEERRQTMGRESDFGPIQIPDLGNESTFVMAPIESSPVRDQTIAEPMEEEDLAQDHGDTDDETMAPLPGLQDDDGDDDGNLEETIIPHPNQVISPERTRGRRKKAGKKISRHGIEYPSLPPSVVKRLATTFAKTAGISKGKISPDTLSAITQATDWFFEQLGDDLSAYAKHAGRKTIDESDMTTLMRRQRQTSASTTPFALAQRHLPRELLQELRMSVPPAPKGSRKPSKRAAVDEGEEVR